MEIVLRKINSYFMSCKRLNKNKGEDDGGADDDSATVTFSDDKYFNDTESDPEDDVVKVLEENEAEKVKLKTSFDSTSSTASSGSSCTSSGSSSGLSSDSVKPGTASQSSGSSLLLSSSSDRYVNSITGCLNCYFTDKIYVK